MTHEGLFSFFQNGAYYPHTPELKRRKHLWDADDGAV